MSRPPPRQASKSLYGEPMIEAALSRGKSGRDSGGTGFTSKGRGIDLVSRVFTVNESRDDSQQDAMSISLRSHPILSGDTGAYDTSRVDEARLIRAAQITLRREIFKHFPAGLEREKRLNWLAEAVAAAGSKRADAP